MELVALEKMSDAEEIEQLWKLIQRHQSYTKSEKATKVLADWKNYVPKFVKVLPQDYANVLKELKKAQEKGLTGDDAVMAAFEANVKGGH
jgi:glutamate synthase (ferredoxin)